MKKLLVIMLVMVLALSLLTACGDNNATPPANNSTPPANSSTPSGNNSSSGGGKTAAGSLDNISDILDEHSRLYDFHKSAIDDSEDVFLALELVSSGMGLLNLASLNLWVNTLDEPGTYGDATTQDGHITRTADMMVFERDFVLGPDEYYGACGEDDHVISNGKIDYKSGVAWYENSEERIDNDHNVYRYDYLIKPGKIVELTQHSWDSEWFGTGNNTVRFTIIDKDEFHFVTAKANKGIEMGLLDFDSAKDCAAMKSLLENAGFEIVYYGVVNGGSIDLK